MNFVTELVHVREASSVQRTSFQLGKPTFYGIEPGCARGCEMDMETGMGFKPISNVLRLVGAAVVEDEMKIQRGFRRPIDLLKKSDEFFGAMPLGDSSHDFARHDVESRIETSCAVALVVVGSALDLPRPEREHRLGSVEGLDLGLLVDREDHGIVRRMQVQADDILNLLRKLGIFADLEGLQSMRLEISCGPNLSHLMDGDVTSFRHQAKTPVRGLFGDPMNGQIQNHFGFDRRNSPRAAGSFLVLQTVEPVFAVAVTPAIDGSFGISRLCCNLVGGESVGEEEDDPCSIGDFLRCISSPEKGLELELALLGDVDCFRWPCHA